MSNSTSFIYALIDPFTNEIRYIGKSTNPEKRYFAHLRTVDNTRCHHWIQKLLNMDAKPILFILEESPDEVINEREKYWIAFYRSKKTNLTNLTLGGDGIPAGYKMSEMAKQNLSRAKKGVPFSDEHRKNMGGKNHRTVTHPEQTPRGENHVYRKHPELHASGERSAACLYPELYRGESNGRAKLTEAQVIEARRWMNEGMSAYQVHKILGVSYSVAKRIKSRKLWKHI